MSNTVEVGVRIAVAPADPVKLEPSGPRAVLDTNTAIDSAH